MKAPSLQLLRALRGASRPSSSTRLLSRHNKAVACSSNEVLCPSWKGKQFSSSSYALANAPKSSYRGPKSEEDTQTDFGAMNVLANMTPPSTGIDACLSDGFHFDNGMKISDGSGCLLISGEAFSWRPWETTGGKLNSMLNAKGQWEVDKLAWGTFDLVWPKPELLILGLGAGIYPISPETRKHINALGIRVDIQDTRNAAAQFNLLATERGVGNVAAAMIPIGWQPNPRK